MRWMVYLCVAALLSGCTSDEDPGPEPIEVTQEPDADDTTSERGGTPPPAPADPAADEETVDDADDLSDDAAADTVQGETAPRGVPTLVIDEHFSGSAAVPAGNLGGSQTWEVPEGVYNMRVEYRTSYSGWWSAVVTIDDEGGAERASTLDACPGTGTFPVPSLAGEFECIIEFTSNIGAGEWTANINWQVGELTEDYTIDVFGWAIV